MHCVAPRQQPVITADPHIYTCYCHLVRHVPGRGGLRRGCRLLLCNTSRVTRWAENSLFQHKTHEQHHKMLYTMGIGDLYPLTSAAFSIQVLRRAASLYTALKVRHVTGAPLGAAALRLCWRGAAQCACLATSCIVDKVQQGMAGRHASTGRESGLQVLQSIESTVSTSFHAVSYDGTVVSRGADFRRTVVLPLQVARPGCTRLATGPSTPHMQLINPSSTRNADGHQQRAFTSSSTDMPRILFGCAHCKSSELLMQRLYGYSELQS